MLNQQLDLFGPRSSVTPAIGATGSFAPESNPALAQSIVRQMGQDYWRLTPATLLMHITGGIWTPAKHLLYVSAQIASALQKGSARIALACPPRHGKSELISYGVPLWVLNRWPSWPIIHTSYGADLSTKFVRRVRDELDTNNELNVHLDVRQADVFTTDKGGGMQGAGVGGPIAGFGAKLLVIDDYLKNMQQASSIALKDQLWDWFNAVAMLRLEPSGSVLIASTRWAKDDIIGRLKDSDVAEQWTFIDFPALAYKDVDDVLGRQPDEVLWGDRYNEERLHEICSQNGGDSSYIWLAVMQQRPIARGESSLTQSMFQIMEQEDFDWESPSLRWIRAWDLAATAGKGDYISGALLAEDKRNHRVICADLQHERIAAKHIEDLLLSTAERDPDGTQIWLEQEPGSSGVITTDNYTRAVLKGFSAHGERATGDKFVRAQPLFACIQNGNFFLLKAKWNQILINEFLGFPDVARHDDIVDSCSLGYNKLVGRRRLKPTWGSNKTAPEAGATGGPERKKSRLIFGCTWRR